MSEPEKTDMHTQCEKCGEAFAEPICVYIDGYYLCPDCYKGAGYVTIGDPQPPERKHTPGNPLLPLLVAEGGECYTLEHRRPAEGGRAGVIASTYARSMRKNEATKEAFEFIALACNSHHGLVEALEYTACAANIDIDDMEPGEILTVHMTVQGVRHIRAALSAAQ